MMNYTLENYEEALVRQVVHMDQAVCYCPEFRATKMMHQYPSRRLQIARAIMKGEMEISDYAGEINFGAILSRQGERWQNFGESQEDCTDATILSRAMLLAKGYDSPATKEFSKMVADGAFASSAVWATPVVKDSKVAVLVDNETAGIAGAEAGFVAYAKAKGMAFANEGKVTFLGFEYFAYGLVTEGIAHLSKVVADLNALNVEKVVVLSAKAAYLLRHFVKKLDIEVSFEVAYLPEMLGAMPQRVKTYIYAGSFNLRYLVNGDLFNALISSDDETQIPTSQEFVPLLSGSGRINKLTIWQKPVGAEYTLLAADEKMMTAIKEDALHDIKAAKAEQILVFEPTAYELLKKEMADCDVKYYLEVL
ncbi:hypothetical protein [Chakrabartyella piscis]|uniref:hypothetical protein n=1 Tax=Chakrabartyella piscis TaxID=2918914 RepID=UPI0029585F7D|nr:hypothetical protein [Chakrabartyella piscis]